MGWARTLGVAVLCALGSLQSAGATTTPVLPLPGPRPGGAACELFLHRLPGVGPALCQSAQLVPSGSRSQKGLPLYWRDVLPPSLPQEGAGLAAPLRVLVVGAMHGDELTSASLALHWIALAQKAGQPVHWRFIPVLNPDGLLARRPTRVNARGVDLNRNFDTPGWEHDAPRHWEKRTRKDPRRWPGTAPLSEPESQFLHAQMDEFRPQLVVSIHAPYGVLDFDGPHEPPQRLGRLRLLLGKQRPGGDEQGRNQRPRERGKHLHDGAGKRAAHDVEHPVGHAGHIAFVRVRVRVLAGAQRGGDGRQHDGDAAKAGHSQRCHTGTCDDGARGHRVAGQPQHGSPQPA